MKPTSIFWLTLLVTLPNCPLAAQSTSELTVLKGLAPVTVLGNSPEGEAALAANYKITGGIQNGTIKQPTLLPYSEQQQQALRDASITSGDLAQLADGLGTTLGAAYLARAHYIDAKEFTNISERVAHLIAYTNDITYSHSSAAKYLFANGTTDGRTAVSTALINLIKQSGGQTDAFGKAYGFPAGAAGADAYGNSRPFQTEPGVTPIAGRDYFNTLANTQTYNRGPSMNLVDSPSYPSGHTTYGYTGALLLALLVPERYQEMIARGAEYGNDRILMGSHYAMDVVAGRTLATYDIAHLLANDPAYVSVVPTGDTPVKDFRAALDAARADVTAALRSACGNTVAVCARQDIGRLSDKAANEAFYDSTQSYNLPAVYAVTEKTRESVAAKAPEAGYLLTAAYPSLTLQEADEILTDTEGPGGGFLDDGSSFGLYSRLNLYAAAGKAAARTAAALTRAQH